MSKTILFSIIGAITGLIVSQISLYVQIKEIEIALFAFSLLVVSFSLVFDKISHPLTIKFLALLAVILSAITLYFFSQDYPSIRKITPLFVIAIIQVTVICTTFFQSWKTTKPHYHYDDLFENAWNNHFFYIFSGLLTGAFLLILGLGGQLFDLLGFSASKFIWDENLVSIYVGALFGAGIGISREHDQLIFKFRSIFFALFRVLAYLTAAIVILFSAALPFSIDVLYANKDTSLILLSIVALSIVLLNALEDTNSDLMPKRANRIFTIQIVLLPMLVGVSLYAIYLRINQYGLMPNRIIALWAALLIGAHAIGYLIQLLLNKGRWKLGFAKVNPPLAFIWVLSILLLALPILDPIKMSAKNQVTRLQNNIIEVEKFDFYALKNRLGKPGKNGIKAIQAWTDHPQNDLIKKRIADTKSKWKDTHIEITVIGEPPKQLNKLKRRYTKWKCSIIKPCFIKKTNLKNEANEQPLVFTFNKRSNNRFSLYTEYFEYNKNRWNKVKTHRSETFDSEKMKRIIKSIKSDKLKLIQPEYSDFEIDGIRVKQ